MSSAGPRRREAQRAAPLIEFLPVEDPSISGAYDPHYIGGPQPAAPHGGSQRVTQNPLRPQAPPASQPSEPGLRNDDNEDAAAADTQQFEKNVLLEYVDADLEQKYVAKWLHRSQRGVLSALGIAVTVVNLHYMYLQSFAASWGVVALSCSCGMYLGTAALNVALGLHVGSQLLQEDEVVAEAPASTSSCACDISRLSMILVSPDVSLKWHRTLLVVFLCGITVQCTTVYAVGEQCSFETQHDPACVKRFPLGIIIGSSVVSSTLPARMRLKLPFILAVWPLALYLPRLAFSGIEPVSWTLIKVGFTIVLSAVLVACAMVREASDRASFETWTGSQARTQRALALRQDFDQILAGSLPLSVAQRLMAGTLQFGDYAEQTTVGALELVNFTYVCVTQLLPLHVVSLLNFLVTGLDGIALRYKCHRLKAVGDTYVVIAGLDEQHVASASGATPERCCLRLVQALHDQQAFVAQLAANAGILLTSRAVAHCGRAVGGLLGLQMLSYEAFGPAMDVALRSAACCPANGVFGTAAVRAMCPVGTFAATPAGTDSQSGPLYALAQHQLVSHAPPAPPADPNSGGACEFRVTSPSPSGPSGASVGDIRYDALCKAALQARRNDHTLNALIISSEKDVQSGPRATSAPTPDKSCESAFANELVFGLRPFAATYDANADIVGRGLVEKVRSLLLPSADTVLFPRLANSAAEAAFRGFETPTVMHGQKMMALLLLVFLTAVLVVASVDDVSPTSQSHDRGSGALVALCSAIAVCLGWFVVLRHLLQKANVNTEAPPLAVALCTRLPLVTVFVTILLFVALGLLPMSIVTGTHYYVPCIFIPAVLTGSTWALPNVCVTVLVYALVGVVEWPRVDRSTTFLVLFAVAVTATVLYISLHGEQSLRRHFELVCISGAQLRACEDELAMHRKMHELLLPPFAAKSLLDRKLLRGTPSFMRHFDELCVVAIRVDGLSDLMMRRLSDGSAGPANLLSVMGIAERRFLKIEDALHGALLAAGPHPQDQQDVQLLAKISSLGDEVLVGGPLRLDGARPSDAVLQLTARVVLHFVHRLAFAAPPNASMSTSASSLFGASASLTSPAETPVAEVVSHSFTVMVAWNSAYLAMLASGCLALQLCGTAPTHAAALLKAAPVGFVGCTERFKSVAERPDDGAAGGGGSLCMTLCRMSPCSVWRAKGAGSVMVSKLSPVAQR